MGIWYSVLADFFGNMLFFYIPDIYLLHPRRGSRYGNYVIHLLIFMLWEIPWRYLISNSSPFPYLLSTYIFTWLLARVMYCDNNKRIFFSWAIYVIIGLLTDAVGLLLLITLTTEYFTWYIHASDNWILGTSGRIMGLLVGEFINMTFALIYLCLIRRKNWEIFLGLMLVPIYQIFLMVGYFMLCSDFSERVAIIGLAMGIFNVILDGVILYLLEGIFKKLDREEELLELEKTRQKEYEYYAADSKYVEEMRLIRHDFSNQLQAVYSMMDDPENAEKVKELLREMEHGIKNAEDSVVDATQIW